MKKNTKTAQVRRTMMDFSPPAPPPVKSGRFLNQKIRLLKPFAVFAGSTGWHNLATQNEIGYYRGERFIPGFLENTSGDRSVIKLEHVTAFLIEGVDFEFVDEKDKP